MNSQTALQVTDFNFYGDNLIALKDNATGEIYTAINSVLRGIGFKDEQVRYQRSKWIKDKTLSKGVLKFNIPTNGGYQLTECISVHKLPLGLAKINITKRLERDYPNITEKLELYQDKCADVLASVFIDRKTISDMNMQPITETLNSITNTLTTLTQTITSMQQEINTIKETQSAQPKLPKKKWSYWSTKMYPKYQLLTEHFNISNAELYKNLYEELQNLYPDIDLNQITEDYCYENNLETCYTLEAIEHNKEIRQLYEQLIDDLLLDNNLITTATNTPYKTIFHIETIK